jgi:ribosomal-protein-alanine N-acetyltransferase
MMNLERQSPAAAHWSRQQYEAMFVTTSSEPRSERLRWVVEDESGAQSEKVPRQVPEILAFLVARQADAEWELENIVVAVGARRCGIGMRLLADFIEHVRTRQGTLVFLEVRESNQSARALYRKAGFEEAGLRKSYYADPPEDAILCRLRLY